MKVPVPICIKCKHFKTEIWNCKAFPKGVPEIILIGKNNHSKPLPDQANNIVFEPIKKKKKPKKVQIITSIDGEGAYTDIDSNPYENYKKGLKKKVSKK